MRLSQSHVLLKLKNCSSPNLSLQETCPFDDVYGYLLDPLQHHSCFGDLLKGCSTPVEPHEGRVEEDNPPPLPPNPPFLPVSPVMQDTQGKDICCASPTQLLLQTINALSPLNPKSSMPHSPSAPVTYTRNTGTPAQRNGSDSLFFKEVQPIPHGSACTEGLIDLFLPSHKQCTTRSIQPLTPD